MTPRRLDDPDAIRDKIAVLDRAMEIDPLNKELRRHRERLRTVLDCLAMNAEIRHRARIGVLFINAHSRRN